MPTIAQLSKSKMIWLSVALAVIGVLQASMDVLTPYVSAQAAGLISVGVGVAVAVLRVLTTHPLTDK